MKSHPFFLLAALTAILFPCLTITCRAETFSIDDDWQFSLGHATDTSKDFNHATGYFSYLTKTGFGDGPASPAFDDRTWRTVDLPHDWAVEVPFDSNGSHSHGYKAVGPRFPENSVGWYRKQIQINEEDLGQKIFVTFDGIYRDADVFINGFFVGNEPSGYLGQHYDVTDYLNYGETNILVVRVDASMEEGWFYEGAGIYRHAWLEKKDPVHFVKDGVWINPQEVQGKWSIQMQSEVQNQEREAKLIKIDYTVVDAEGQPILSKTSEPHLLSPGATITDHTTIDFENTPRLWDIEDPYLYKLKAEIKIATEKNPVDSYQSSMGIRTTVWDPDLGFFLNGKAIKLVGSNNHQDHAGVGAAIPDSLQEWRIEQLKTMGNNIYRASHNPMTPELLVACDRLGMLVIDETRLMGINDYHLSQLTRMVRRDRNHASIILWSLGNEEWGIEGNIKGARITQTMQDFCHRLDPTRYTTVAISGGWGGVSHTVQVAGVNYIGQADPDQQHKDYPEQIILGTEETTTQQTRGIYVRNDERCFLPPLEDGSSKGNCEIGWKYYAERDWGAGVIFWTGFDYRGEPTPFAYPAINSQFGILDTCGFPKDSFYYLKSWWTDEPVLHLFPHWNWKGREGESIEVRLHSNCRSAELFLNEHSLGSKTMELNGHLTWDVPYQPGTLKVIGTWEDGSERTTVVATTGEPHHIKLSVDRTELTPDRNEVAMVTVKVVDAKGRGVPNAENAIQFEIEGVGKIIGVGNGNPSSLEPDVFVEKVWGEKIGDWTAPNPADATTPIVWETTFDAPKVADGTQIQLLFNALGDNQSVSLNGKTLEGSLEIAVNENSLKPTGNTLKIEATPFPVWRDREGLFQFHPAQFRFEQPAAQWQRKVFNSLAQVIVAASEEEGEGEIILKATSKGLKSDVLKISVSD